MYSFSTLYVAIFPHWEQALSFNFYVSLANICQAFIMLELSRDYISEIKILSSIKTAWKLCLLLPSLAVIMKSLWYIICSKINEELKIMVLLVAPMNIIPREENHTY